MFSTMLAGFFGAVSAVSIVVNYRYGCQIKFLKKENEKLEEELIEAKLRPLVTTKKFELEWPSF